MEQEVDVITRQVEWIKARGLGGNDQLVKMMRYIERLEEQVKPITWTTEKPTTPGMWWFRRPSMHGGFYIDTCRVHQNDIDYDTFQADSEWSSEPIAEPQEASS